MITRVEIQRYSELMAHTTSHTNYSHISEIFTEEQYKDWCKLTDEFQEYNKYLSKEILDLLPDLAMMRMTTMADSFIEFTAFSDKFGRNRYLRDKRGEIIRIIVPLDRTDSVDDTVECIRTYIKDNYQV